VPILQNEKVPLTIKPSGSAVRPWRLVENSFSLQNVRYTSARTWSFYDRVKMTEQQIGSSSLLCNLGQLWSAKLPAVISNFRFLVSKKLRFRNKRFRLVKTVYFGEIWLTICEIMNNYNLINLKCQEHSSRIILKMILIEFKINKRWFILRVLSFHLSFAVCLTKWDLTIGNRNNQICRITST